MSEVAKVFMSGNSQAIRLPRKYRVDVDEMYISQEGDAIVLTPRPRNWKGFLSHSEPLSEDFSTEGSPLPQDVPREAL